jgi:hypothetical protein
MQRRHLWSLKLLSYPSKGLEYIKIYIIITKKIDINSIIWVGSNFTLFHIIHMFRQMNCGNKSIINLLFFVRFSETLNWAGQSKIVFMNNSI